MQLILYSSRFYHPLPFSRAFKPFLFALASPAKKSFFPVPVPKCIFSPKIFPHYNNSCASKLASSWRYSRQTQILATTKLQLTFFYLTVTLLIMSVKMISACFSCNHHSFSKLLLIHLPAHVNHDNLEGIIHVHIINHPSILFTFIL